MNGKIKIIGTNKITNFLHEEDDENGSIEHAKGIHKIKFKNEQFLFDLKKSIIIDDSMILWGWISDEKMAGQVCIQFFPKTS